MAAATFACEASPFLLSDANSGHDSAAAGSFHLSFVLPLDGARLLIARFKGQEHSRGK